MSLPTNTTEYRFSETTALQGLTLRDAPLSSPRASEVLVKIHAASLNYHEMFPKSVEGRNPKILPLVPCSDAAGEVVAIGSDVTKWKSRDRVMSNVTLDHLVGDVTAEIKATTLGEHVDGVLTQFRSFPAHSLVKIPEHFSYEEAATLPCSAVTAWNSLYGPTPVKAGDFVLIEGTGGVSIFGLQFAVASGATVIVTSSSNEKLEVARTLGAAYTINYNENPDWDEEVLKITAGRGVDHILDVAGAGSLNKALGAVRYAGWIHGIGFVSGGDGDLTVSGLILRLIHRAAMYRAIWIGSVQQFEDMNRLISAKKLRPVIDKVFAFKEVPEAYAYLASQKHVGKVVVRISQ
ncbi:NAD-P-binding protein [Panus rudis PR-1116 ss-1]|nr:NAD-P-binding protein [Panus rudis PR-1116 ss-1]